MSLCWQPHPVQAKIKNSLFSQGKKKIFVECGRKFGKTDFLIFILYRIALSQPNSACYYISPLQKQAKELIWANNRLQLFFLPKVDPKTGLTPTGHNQQEAFKIYEELKERYMAGEPNNTEMRIKFKNGSFIKLDGSDQYESYRGINPHAIAYDEFKDHHPRFHVGMDPNLATFNAPLIVVGTPPVGEDDNGDQFTELADFCMKDPESEHIHSTPYDNPYISNEWLDKKKAELYSRGKEDEWLIEYMAQRIKSGSRSIFPMFDGPSFLPSMDMPTIDEDKPVHTVHYRPYSECWEKVTKYHKDWDYFMAFDPASASTFAVIFGAINRKSKEVVLLNEIYEKSKMKMTSKRIFSRAMAMADGFPVLIEDIRMIYDTAATWFQNEVNDQFGYNLEPAMKDINRKSNNEKENRLNLIKDMLFDGYLILSDQCPCMAWEIANHRTDEHGRIPKEDDHLLDAFRYGLANHHYNSIPPKRLPTDLNKRYHTIESDMKRDRTNNSPFERVLGEYYE